MDVRLPDGTLLQGVPDGTTKAQLYEKLKANGYDVSQLDAPKPEPTMADRLKQGAGDMAAGAVRGAGSIGATILAPVDAAARALNNGKPLNIGGYDIVGQDRRAGMDAGLTELGADTNSLAFKGGKLGAEIAGTMGAGGAAANVLGRAAPAMAARAAPALDALRTAGMSAGGVKGAGGLALRTAGGAASGGLSAGLVNPDDAGAGMLIGGVLPGASQLVGKGSQAIGSTLRGPAQTPELQAAIQAARQAGYVIPPTQAKPTLANRMLEGLSGKITTAQNASARNQGVTNRLAAEALGLPGDTKLTPDLLAGIRKQAGAAYNAIGQTGTVQASQAYMQALDDIAAPFVKSAQAFPNAKPSPVLDLVESLKSPAFDAAAAVEKIKQLRTAADDGFRAGNTDVARASKAAAKALEDALEGHLQAIGQPDMLQAFKQARQQIAKTYTVEKALNPASGSVDARKLAGELKKGKPLAGELRDVANFASTFPKASQAIEGMGSLPQTSPLDWALGGSLSMATANPLMMGAMLARPAARTAALSGPVQNRLVQQPSNALARITSDPRLQLNLLRATPVGLVGGQ
jgi:hypothetical protein